MKKIFTLLLTVMFTMGIQAQDFADYASVVGQSYNQLSRQFSDLEELFEGFYTCSPNDGKTESLMVVFNGDLEVYMAAQSLNEDAYTLDQIIAYMDGKYTKYEPEVSEYTDEDTGEVITTTTYSYGNTPAIEDATLLIVFSDNSYISYTNPKAMPEPAQGGIGEITPIEAANAFIGETLEDIEDEYPGMFTEMSGMYAAFASEDDTNEYLEGIVLELDDNNVVSEVRLLYMIGDEEVVAYYTENGYTCTENGTFEEEGETYTKYIITNGTFTITYSAGSGTVVRDGSDAISTLKQNGNSAAWYSVDGNRLNSKPNKKGLYIHGDRKVIIK